MISSEKQRFASARDAIITFDERERHGIGMQKEKTLHAVIKNFEDPDEDHQEIPIGSYIADIYNDGFITEIQTANFGNLRRKLDAFLPEYKVKVVYPIPHIKYVTWIDPETGALLKRSRSPKKGSYYDAFKELYRIRPYLQDKNLIIELLLIDLEEYRLKDGWSRDGKRGSHRYDRVPTSLHGSLTLERPEDYIAFIPNEIQEPFTTKDFAKAAGYRSSGFSTVLLLLTEAGVIERIGKQRNSYLYRISEKYREDFL